ncbi:MAG TPA: phosphotransferase [Dermatophilaceae bacterium]|nr:phosphotransferase [Dermatophilaceae bacterium]
MDEHRLEGGYDGGATVVDGTVRRVAGPWSPSVRKLLRHLLDRGFAGAPQPLGADALGREVVSYLPGVTVGSCRPWPDWTHSDEALAQVAGWLRRFHDAVLDFDPGTEAVWREGGTWRPGLVIGHNDAAPYNAVWDDDRLVGFVDWDMCGPLAPESDLAWVAFSWVPLHARDVVEAEGFSHFSDRRRRLELFLREYGSNLTANGLLEVLRRRLRENIDAMRMTARSGDATYQRMLEHGVDRSLVLALEGLDEV